MIVDAQPELASRSLDLDDNMIVLTFTPMVLNPINNGQPIDCSAVLVGPVSGNSSMAERLLNSTVGMQVDTSMAYCDLGEEFRGVLESYSGFGTSFATSSTDTYLYYDPVGVTGTGVLLVDTSNASYSNTTGAAAMSVVTDSSPPAIANFFTLDLDEGTLEFNFSQPVNTSTLGFTDLSLQNFPVTLPGSIAVPLTGGSCSEGCNIGRVVTLSLAPADLDMLKLETSVCTMATNCYPHHTMAFAEDFGGNPITAYSFGDSYVLRNFTPDTTPPIIDNCTLDLSLDQLILDFDEPVDVASFTPSSVILTNSSAGTNNFTLTSASVIMGPSSAIITVDLGSDADDIKTSSFITMGSTIFLSFLPSAFNDTSGNNINSSTPRQCMLTLDTSAPNVSSFILDLNSNFLQLTFTEPILAESLNTSAFNLTDGTGTVVVNLGDGELLDSTGSQASGVLRMISVSFDSESLVAIKTDNNIGTTTANTFLVFSEYSFLDLSGNPSLAVGPIPATDVTPDSSPATAVDFSLDMNIGQVVLTFSDVVDVSTLRSGEIFIQDDATSAISMHGLSGTSSSANSNIIVIDLDPDNLISLKYQLLGGVATDINSTYLTIRAHAIDDLTGLDIIAVTDGNGIIANNYIKDTTPPLLDDFDLDMDTGMIFLTFD